MLLKKANTITTPTAYSNGFLHSVKPEVVENLLLQSNQFDTSWNLFNGTLTSGQSGYDGSNDAWLLDASATLCNVQQGINESGINTFSVYAKAGTQEGVFMRLDGGSNPRSFFNLSDGTIGAQSGSILNTFIQDVGNGWYRCGISTDESITIAKIYVSTPTTFPTSGNIYIQDAQLNKGVTAYPYLETTTEAKPSADFSFSRNSSATRVNELGYIEDVQIIGGELVSNGDFEEIGSELITNGNFSDGSTGWDIENTWTIENGAANGNGANGSAEELQISYIIPAGIYKVVFEVKNYVSGNVRPFFEGGMGTSISANGVYTIYQTTTADRKLKFRGTDFIGSIDNVSVKEVGQDWTFGTGWTMGDGKAVCDGTNSVFVRQDNITTSGKKYRITYEIKDYVSGSVRYRANSINGISRSGNGIYTEDIVVATTQFSIQSLNFIGSIDNISVKEVTDDTNLPRINYEGFTYAESLGDNLVVNGTFDTDSDWTKGTGWTISGGVAVKTSGTGSALSQTLPTTTIGKKYKFTFDAIVTSGVANATLYGITIPNFTTSGSQEHIITATSTSGFTFYAASNFIGSIDNVSVQEVIGDLPVPYSGKGHLLLEGQRSNTAFEGGPLRYTNATETTNYGISPSGDNDSIKLESTTATASYVRTSALSTIGNQCHSIYVKKGIGDYIQLLQSADVNHYANYDIVNGVVTASGSATTASIESYGDWYRLIAVYDSVTNTAAGARCYLSDNPTAGYNGASSAIGNYCEFWGIQVEIGDYATSYIANTTPSTTVTRLGETCNNATQSFPSEGVLYAEIAALADDGTFREMTISDGSTNNRIILSFDNLNRVRVKYRNSGTNVFDEFYVIDTTEYNKIGIRSKENDFSLWINGSLIVSDTSGAILPSNTLNELAFDDGTGNFVMYSKTKMVATFPYLSNDEMECLTGEGYGTFEALAAAYSYTIK